MIFLKNIKSGLKGIFTLPQGMVFATRAVTKFESNHPEILKNLKNLTLRKEPEELVKEVARIIVLEGLNGQSPEVRQQMSDPQVIDHMVKETIGSIRIGFINKYRSDKLQDKYFAAGIKGSNVDFIGQVGPSTLSDFHIIDGIGDYTQTKNLIHDSAAAVVLALSEEKIDKVVEEMSTIEDEKQRQFKTIGAFVKEIYEKRGKFLTEELIKYYSEADLKKLKELGLLPEVFAVEHKSPFVI